MAVRTTIEEVRDKAEFQLSDEDIQSFIEDASLFVDDRLDGSTETQKALVEPWVAAHLASMKDPSVRISKSRIGPSSVEYEGRYDGTGLESTRFGQTAILLDETGKLAGSQRHFSMAVNTREED